MLGPAAMLMEPAQHRVAQDLVQYELHIASRGASVNGEVPCDVVWSRCVERPRLTWRPSAQGVGADVAAETGLFAAHARGVYRPGRMRISSSLARSTETRYSCTGTPAATAV